jgi:photosystem II stability/assembly factor-like uncharacterized protein
MKGFTASRPLAAALIVLCAGCASLAPPAREAQSPAVRTASAAGAVPPFVPRPRPPGAPRLKNDREQGPANAKYNLEIESDESGPPTAAQIMRAHAQRAEILKASHGLQKMAGLQPSQWQPLGPSNVGGRLRALAFDPARPNRLLAGSATGGLWVSEDAGVTWRANFDFLPNLSISTIVFDRLDPRNVYIGTGEASQGFVGVGVFKSTDGGNTFTFLGATNVDANPDWRFVNRLAIHPTQPKVLLAGTTNVNFTTGAIYRSADAGATWTRVSALKTLDIAFSPTDPSHALAGLDDGTLAYSGDAGLTWQKTAALATPASGETARAEIAFARSQPGVAYTSIDNASGEVWRSTDFGATWQKMSTPAHLAGQGDYDNAIWVDPTDANHVLVAGLDIYQSHDGGLTFTQVSDRRNPPSPHADHHQLVSPPDFGQGSSALYDGNDGGLYRADNVYSLANGTVGVGWTNLNEGLAVTQFYGGAGTSTGRIVGGTQDNGSLMLANNQWFRVFGGDGGRVAYDPTLDYSYGEYVYLTLHRSVGPAQGIIICNGITEANDDGSCGANTTKKANFIAPFILDPNNPQRMLAGANSLWVTDNVRAGKPAWRVAKAPSAATDNFINAIAVQPGNGNVVWVGHNNGELYKSSDALSATPTWTRVGAGVLPGRIVMSVLPDPANANHVIVAFTGFVANNLWQTMDGGATWTSITGNLPAAPIFDVKRHPANPSWLYVGTSVGVFTSENGGATWSTSNEGPANIRVRELFWLDNGTLGAATFGRGMFKASLGNPGMANYQDLWWAGTQENGWGMSIAQHDTRLFAAMFIYDDAGKPIWVVMPGGDWNATNTVITGALYIPTGAYFANYDPSHFAVGSSVGSATISFADANNATLTYTINGKSGTKTITRQPFGPADQTPTASYGDLWWGGKAQDGWGIAINQQYRTLFSIWYTYDASGNTVWYVIPGGTWTAANVFTGTAYRTTGSAWIGSSFKPVAPQDVKPAGTVTFTFGDNGNGTMTYNVDGVTGSKAITRQAF